VSKHESEITALCERFEARARALVQEAALAARSGKLRNCVGLTAMASSLQWAARELYFCARISRTEVKVGSDRRTRRRRVYRLAHREPSSGYTQIGRAYLSFDLAGTGAIRQNAMRGEFGLPAVTHAVVYEEVGITELTKPPELGESFDEP
jgi:hypothetical protein